MEYDYGGAYLRYPLAEGVPHEFPNGSIIQVHDIFDPLPKFMLSTDLVFTDSPWNKGNMNTFYVKAEKQPKFDTFETFYNRLFECIQEIGPKVCYLEIGKQYLADFIKRMQSLYKHVTFYNSSYYHKRGNICYVVRGSQTVGKPKLDYLDEEDIIAWVCKNEEYDCIGDLCMGRGLVGHSAHKNGRKFVGTELNGRRLSVLLEKIYGGEHDY